MGEVSDVRDGTHDSPKYQSIGHPFVTSKNVKNGYITYDDIQYISDEDFVEINKRSKVDVNDILMGMIGTIGNMALIRTEPDFAIKNVALIKDTKQINYLYLYHLLQSPFIEKQLTSGMDGGTQKFVSLGNVRNLNVIYPSDIEQDKIGCYFEKLDHLITLHQRKSFYNIANINVWEQRKLESLCDVFTDGDWIEAKDQSDSGIRLVQTGNVGTTEYLDKKNNKKWISEETFERLHCEEIYEGDILISRLPEPAGRACIVPDLGVRMITAVDCTIVRTSKEYDSKYLVQYLSTPMYFKIVNSFLGGGTRQRISRGNLSGIDIPIPSTIEEQWKIGEFFSNLDHLITLHRRAYHHIKRRTYKC